MTTLNLSYSSRELLHECARKFELEKLLAPEGIGENSLDLVCGKSFGVGLQKLLGGASVEQAIWYAMLAWTFPTMDQKGLCRDEHIEASRSLYEQSKKKAFFYVVHHLEKAEWTIKEKLEGWKLWTLPGSNRPAVEVGFRIKLPNGSFQRGFIDAILVRDEAGQQQFACLEIKTSGFENIAAGYYQNSEQGNSYAFITDFITRQVNPQLFYFIAEFPKMGQQVMEFWKGPADKVSWLPSLALDINYIEMMMRAKHFPMNGKACMNYFRPCKYLGVCNLTRSGPWKEHKEEPAALFDYNFTLEEILKVKDELYAPR